MMREPSEWRRKRSLSDPPRYVPLFIKLKILFGGFNNQFGWLFFGFGLMFVWVFGGNSLLYNTAFFSGELAMGNGTITAIEETNVSINDNKVYRYRYNYKVDDELYQGSTKAFYGEYQEGATAEVEYCVDDHSRSRAKGLSTDLKVFFITPIFAIIGLIFIVFGVRKGIKGARLLRDGKQAEGMFVSKKGTGARVNDQPVYKYTFSFQAEDHQTYQVVAKTHVKAEFASEKEPLLYHPLNPMDAVLLDDLPGSPRINSRGEIQSKINGMSTLILPGIAIAAHICWALHVLEML